MDRLTRSSKAGQCIGRDYAPDVAPVRKTPQHTVVVDDELWNAAKDIAAKRRERLSDVLRRALVEYVEKYGGSVNDKR